MKERTGDRQLKRSKSSAPIPSGPPIFTPAGHEPLEFGHRHIEKNFTAGDGEGLGVYSLGVRTAVLRLELFDEKNSRRAVRSFGPHSNRRSRWSGDSSEVMTRW